MTNIIKKEVITLPEVKEILERVKPDDMDQIQRWTFDYVGKFAKTNSKMAQKMVKQLIQQCELKEEEAVGGCKYNAYVFGRIEKHLHLDGKTYSYCYARNKINILQMNAES